MRRPTRAASMASSARVRTRTAMVVRGLQYPVARYAPLAVCTRTGSPGSASSRPVATAPEKIHGCPARTRASRPGLSTTARTAFAAALGALARSHEGAAPAAALADQPDRSQRHLAIDRLAHVVEGEAGDGHGGEGLHLRPRAGLHPHPALDAHPARGVGREFQIDVQERQGMAERDQI